MSEQTMDPKYKLEDRREEIQNDIFSADTQLLEDDDNEERSVTDKDDIHPNEVKPIYGGVEQNDRHYKTELTSLRDADEKPNRTKTDTGEKGCVAGVGPSATIPPEKRYPDEEDGYGWMELGIQHMEAAAEEFRFGLSCQMKGTVILKSKRQY